MLISIATAKDASSFLSQCTDVDSISSYLSQIGQELSQLELSMEEKESIVAAFQSTLFSGRSKPAAEDDVYQNEFQDGEFEEGYEEKLRRRWKGSKSVEERKELALEGHRTLIGLKPGTEVRDESSSRTSVVRRKMVETQDGRITFRNWPIRNCKLSCGGDDHRLEATALRIVLDSWNCIVLQHSSMVCKISVPLSCISVQLSRDVSSGHCSQFLPSLFGYVM